MRKLILMALAVVALALVAPPQSSSAAPISNAAALQLAADGVSSTEQVRHRRWHRRHYTRYRYVRRHWRPRRAYYRTYAPRRYYYRRW